MEEEEDEEAEEKEEEDEGTLQVNCLQAQVLVLLLHSRPDFKILKAMFCVIKPRDWCMF